MLILRHLKFLLRVLYSQNWNPLTLWSFVNRSDSLMSESLCIFYRQGNWGTQVWNYLLLITWQFEIHISNLVLQSGLLNVKSSCLFIWMGCVSEGWDGLIFISPDEFSTRNSAVNLLRSIITLSGERGTFNFLLGFWAVKGDGGCPTGVGHSTCLEERELGGSSLLQAYHPHLDSQRSTREGY